MGFDPLAKACLNLSKAQSLYASFALFLILIQYVFQFPS